VGRTDLDEVGRGNEAIYIFLIVWRSFTSCSPRNTKVLSFPRGHVGASPRDIRSYFFSGHGLANNIYAQVGLIMLVGLLGKNAVLIAIGNLTKKPSGVILRCALGQSALSAVTAGQRRYAIAFDTANLVSSAAMKVRWLPLNLIVILPFAASAAKRGGASRLPEPTPLGLSREVQRDLGANTLDTLLGHSLPTTENSPDDRAVRRCTHRLLCRLPAHRARVSSNDELAGKLGSRPNSSTPFCSPKPRWIARHRERVQFRIYSDAFARVQRRANARRFGARDEFAPVFDPGDRSKTSRSVRRRALDL